MSYISQLPSVQLQAADHTPILCCCSPPFLACSCASTSQSSSATPSTGSSFWPRKLLSSATPASTSTPRCFRATATACSMISETGYAATWYPQVGAALLAEDHTFEPWPSCPQYAHTAWQRGKCCDCQSIMEWCRHCIASLYLIILQRMLVAISAALRPVCPDNSFQIV